MFTDIIDALMRDPSSPIGATYRALLAQGMPATYVVHNADTDEVLMVDASGQSRPAHGAIREMITGEPWRDPGDLNPVPSYAVRQSPTRMAAHEAELQDMWRYLVSFYRPAFRTLPQLDDYADEAVARLRKPHIRRGLAAMADNYERWNMIVGASIETLDEMHGPAAG